MSTAPQTKTESTYFGSLATLLERYDVEQLANWFWLSLAQNDFYPMHISSSISADTELMLQFETLSQPQQHQFRFGLERALSYWHVIENEPMKYTVLTRLIFLAGTSGTARQALSSLGAIAKAYQPRLHESGVLEVLTTLMAVLRGVGSNYDVHQLWQQLNVLPDWTPALEKQINIGLRESRPNTALIKNPQQNEVAKPYGVRQARHSTPSPRPRQSRRR